MYPNFIRKLIVYLSNNSRHYDIKYFCHPYRIEILLLDTPLNVAKLYIEKIMRKLFNFAVSRRLIEYIYLIEHANISAYPINHISISESVSLSCLESESYIKLLLHLSSSCLQQVGCIGLVRLMTNTSFKETISLFYVELMVTKVSSKFVLRGNQAQPY